ncbi:MAG: sulfatase-like hydrolase/transferase [Alphaproteobacteria bacterium]|nr:sulfatase-like hydrolase/transferase [Alphaproteobacteria bacterium]
MTLLLLALGCGPVENGPPITVSIAPAEPVQGRDALVCETAASRVHWLVDGAPVPAVSGKEVPAETTRLGREWTCVADVRPVKVEATVTARPLGGNVLVFLIDDIGVDKVAVYDQLDDAPPQTPVIDGLADTGIRFHRAWSAPVCSPTRATLLTGRYGRRTGLGRIIDEEAPNQILAYEEIFVPEMLAYSDLAYATAMTGKWHLAWLRPRYLDHPSAGAGFAYHTGSMDNLGRAIVPDGEPRGYWHWENNANGSIVYRDRYATDYTVEQAVGLTENMPEPWFLYVPFNGAHVPYHEPPAEYVYTPPVDDSSPELFRAMVESVDIAIGNILDGMPADVRERTTVFVIGDNGTAQASTLPEVEFAKGSVLEPGIRVPFVVNGHGVETVGVSHALVNTVDLFDTIAAMTGADLGRMDAELEGLPRDSKSFLPVLADLEAGARTLNYAEYFTPNGPGPYEQSFRAVTDGRFKLVDVQGGPFAGSLLFDLDGAGEAVDLLAEGPLDPEAQAAYDALDLAMLGYVEDLVYDAPFEVPP